MDDQTDRLLVEIGALRQRVAALERANTELEERIQFAVMLAHEFRSPLHVIMSWLGVLRETRDEGLRERAIETIERSTRVQARFIDDFVDVMGLTSKKLHLELRSVDLASVIEAAITDLGPAAEAKGIRLESSLQVSGRMVVGDPDRLKQVVGNLLSNSIKFTPRGGRIEARLEGADPHIRIRVSDTGRGIPPDFLPHVFEPFRRAKSPTMESGLGLGLTLVRQVVELHGGTVEAESTGEGRGSTFTVTLRRVADPGPPRDSSEG